MARKVLDWEWDEQNGWISGNDAALYTEIALIEEIERLQTLIAEGELERQLNAKWGVGQFNWCTVQTGGNAKPQWAWFCGTPPGQRGKWMYEGMADTLVQAMTAMLDVTA